MNYYFGEFRLDTSREELFRDTEPVDVEPLALRLLKLLIENRARLVTKDEIFEEVWNDRIVSESALSTCIKSARRAVEDTGSKQGVIKTVHGKGFRWLAPVRTDAARTETTHTIPDDLDEKDGRWIEASRRPTVAILPFDVLGSDPAAATLAQAIPHELIAEISRLRWIAVIARGSTFRFNSAQANFAEIRDKLGTRYCLTGCVEMAGRRANISVELSETVDGDVIWADFYKAPIERVHEVRETIVAQVVFAIEVQIPLSEAAKARLRSPDSIDVWAAYHLGLQSLYHFDKNENDRAIAMFDRAIALEPGFARAHAARSFAHFKTAFMNYSADRETAVTAARRAAERAIELDPMDPFANFSMGRSLWLVGDLNGAQGWLKRSTSLSPSFAQGFYARAWTEMVSCCSETGRKLSDQARNLSPLDPLLYGMLGTRALCLMMEDRNEEAAMWADRAANAPGAHFLIWLIAAIANDLAGNREAAANWAQRVWQHRRDISQEHFFRSFPFADEGVRARFSGALTRHGFS
ncbi:winged helix-turn-helix domain-containing tetratricopeptide repeat protein [Roseibium sp. SCP14]|uniref:winged helix-turn-helix domain-containing tetratricopeptide repeat protein n=1 Tax=Roseibium sp. SCP14 TaxID=3141375 RepID=UPI003337C458